MNQNDLNRYFEKIGFTEKADVSLKTLSELQKRHLETFPFENLNPLCGLAVEIDLDSLKEKYLNDKRGGYCFEQNLFFKEVLRSLGFKVKSQLGRVGLEDLVLARTHLCTLVDLDGVPYTVDVGFGGHVPTQPIQLENSENQTTKFGVYRYLKEGTNYTLQLEKDQDWLNLYTFDLNEYLFPDFIVANWYTSTHPDSNFTKNLMLSIISGNQRLNLRNNTFSIYEEGKEPQRVELKTVDEIKEVMRQRFLIDFSQIENIDTQLQKLV